MNLVPGTVLKTADGQVGTGDKPVRVFAIHLISGASAGNITLKNGGSGGTDYVQVLAPQGDAGYTENFAGGMRFPDGCYYAETTAPTSALISYTEEF